MVLRRLSLSSLEFGHSSGADCSLKGLLGLTPSQSFLTLACLPYGLREGRSFSGLSRQPYARIFSRPLPFPSNLRGGGGQLVLPSTWSGLSKTGVLFRTVLRFRRLEEVLGTAYWLSDVVFRISCLRDISAVNQGGSRSVSVLWQWASSWQGFRVSQWFLSHGILS